jgi:hypothetical protein
MKVNRNIYFYFNVPFNLNEQYGVSETCSTSFILSNCKTKMKREKSPQIYLEKPRAIQICNEELLHKILL